MVEVLTKCNNIVSISTKSNKLGKVNLMEFWYFMENHLNFFHRQYHHSLLVLNVCISLDKFNYKLLSVEDTKVIL